MNPSFFPRPVRPNLPLRKPASNPAALTAMLPPPRQPNMAVASPGRPAGGATMTSPGIGDTTTGLGSMPPALSAYFCNFCGHQANFQCQRCKKINYCSEVCQKEDWKAHRHVCKSTEPDLTKEKQTTASPGKADNSGPLESKHGDEMSPQRIYLKDLPAPQIKNGSDIQASLLEFYSPSRFFLCAQTPELLKALQSISTELQSTNSSASVTTYTPCVGEVCAVQFSCDLNWYRGLVQSLAVDNTTASILYIDFGNQENAPLNRIRPLTANIQPLYPCAMECCIAKVVPVSGNWSEECCATIKQLLAGKALTARLMGTKESCHTHAVEILLPTGKQLSTLLIEQGYAAKETTYSRLTPTEEEIDAMVNASLENFKRHSDGKDDNTWAKPPEPLTQAVGDCFPVVVTHFKSPNEIIVQKVENAGVIQDLQLKLREHCSQIIAPMNFRPAPGTVCCAQFSEDKQWYRAKILAYSSEERVCVGYLDFGNSEEVDLTQLLPISTSLLALPLQAIPCGIAGVQPVEENWSQECLLALQRRISNRILRMQIQGGSDGKVFVAMVDEASDPQANIAELLISAAYAAPASAPVNSSGNQQVPQATTDDRETCVSPQLSQPLVWTPAELPHEGQTVALLASVVENPGEFFCHIDSPTDQQRLISLGTEVKTHCETNPSPFTPRVGEPCCAMIPGDTRWYRAAVKGLFEDKVEVNFVDYGYIVKTDKSHLRSITPQLLKLPIQAVRCWLTGVEPLGSEWSSEALLWFQTLVGGQQLSAHVLSVTERGCGVALESRGQDVAAALVAEQLAKATGEIPKEQLMSASSAAKQPIIQETEHGKKQMAVQQTGGSEETKGLTEAATPAPTFPVDWKTVELPLNATFEPLIAAVISPSLFYLLHPGQADRQKLQEVMAELAAYCSNSQTCLSSGLQSRPVPGAACCARFSADNNWYRAVVLEIGEGEMSVIYADYGNMEKVPVSRILPIPAHLLWLPFQITRCRLVGEECFPAVWPEQVQEMFRGLLSKGVLGTVQSFDGISNVLSLILPADKGSEDVSAVIVQALQSNGKDPGPSAAVSTEQTSSSMSASSSTGATDLPNSQSLFATLHGSVAAARKPKPETPAQTHSRNTVNEDPVQRILEQLEPPCRISSKANDSQAQGCCCATLNSKVDHLEQLMQTQLSLVKQLLGQAK